MTVVRQLSKASSTVKMSSIQMAAACSCNLRNANGGFASLVNFRGSGDEVSS